MPPSDEFRSQLTAASDDLERLVSRLARLSALAWRTRSDAVAALLRKLVEICERQQGRLLPALELEVHVLADAVAVIGREIVDTLRTAPDVDQISDLRAAIEAALAATR